MEKPELSDCICKMKEVLKGDMTREELSDWAGGYVYADDPEVEEERVWNLLILLSGFDLKDSPGNIFA
nr:DNA-binding protein [Bacillus paralicheniformis]